MMINSPLIINAGTPSFKMHKLVTILFLKNFSGRRCLHLERFAGGCDLRSITAGVQTTPEDSSVQPQLSEHLCYLNFVFLL